MWDRRGGKPVARSPMSWGATGFAELDLAQVWPFADITSMPLSTQSICTAMPYWIRSRLCVALGPENIGGIQRCAHDVGISIVHVCMHTSMQLTQEPPP